MQVYTAKKVFCILVMTFTLSFLQPLASQAQARKVQAPESQMGVVLVEIIEKDARPKAAGDEYLYFRLYESGNMEFEVPFQNRNSEWESHMHKLNLNEVEKGELSILARECLSVPNDFDPLQRIEEKISITRIRVRYADDYRQVVIHNYSPENEKTKFYYPKAAMELMQKVNLIREKYKQKA